MDPQEEIRRIKRRRMLVMTGAGLLALAAYFLWRHWSYSSWHADLQAALPARQEAREAVQRRFLGAACGDELNHTRERGARRAAGLPASLHEVVSFSDNAADQRRALERLRARLISELYPGEVRSPLRSELIEAPTFYLHRIDDPLVGLGAWQFTRHLFDARGKLLLRVPAGGKFEGVLAGQVRLREQLELYDYVVSLDLPPSVEACEPLFEAAIAQDFIGRLLGYIEEEAGGAVHWVALESAGRVEPLVAALAHPRIGQIELTGPLAKKQRPRAALALALLGDRYLIVHEDALGTRALEELEAALELLGSRGNLEIR